MGVAAVQLGRVDISTEVAAHPLRKELALGSHQGRLLAQADQLKRRGGVAESVHGGIARAVGPVVLIDALDFQTRFSSALPLSLL
jgi:hypothetical protein